MSVALSLLKAGVRDRLTYDLGPLRSVVAGTLYAAASAFDAAGRQASALALFTKIHRAALSKGIDRRVVARVVRTIALDRTGQATGLPALLDLTIRRAIDEFRTWPQASPARLIGSRILVVKTARPRERGVLVADYNFMMPLLAGLFDVKAIARRYFIVFEPGWNGYCTPEILLYSSFEEPVFVQTLEPRDSEVLAALGAPFQTVFPVSTNSWVDYRFTVPRPLDQRDIDVVMVAAWAEYKRHWRFFHALAALRRRGHLLRVALIGYPMDKTRAGIEAEARYYGVADQLEFFERITAREVSEVLARSKLHVLWSRREGSNRAIIEALFADVPTIVRDGFNYGHRYAHINSQTGQFVAEADLADAILKMLQRRHEFSPREWALQHVTCQRSTQIVEAAVREKAVAMGEEWTEGLVVKTSNLDGQEYWNPADRQKFADDYAFLASVARPA